MDDDIDSRIRRMFAAVGEGAEDDLTKFAPELRREGEDVVHHQDFRGGLTEEQIRNVADLMIYRVAHFRDHLRKWARTTGRDPKAVEQAVTGSMALRIVLDLSDSDKHGGKRRSPGCSGREPRLIDVDRVLRISSRSPGSVAQGVFTLAGVELSTTGSGGARVVTTGTVVDEHGQSPREARPTS